jgi:hypothetical protein
MKIIVPTIALIEPLNLKIAIYLMIFTGFYLHFVSMLLELVKNDDLKTRTYMFLALTKLMQINSYLENEAENEESSPL